MSASRSCSEIRSTSYPYIHQPRQPPTAYACAYADNCDNRPCCLPASVAQSYMCTWCRTYSTVAGHVIYTDPMYGDCLTYSTALTRTTLNLAAQDYPPPQATRPHPRRRDRLLYVMYIVPYLTLLQYCTDIRNTYLFLPWPTAWQHPYTRLPCPLSAGAPPEQQHSDILSCPLIPLFLLLREA